MDFLFYANLQIKDEVILMENRGLKPKNPSLARAFLEEYLELIQEYEFEPWMTIDDWLNQVVALLPENKSTEGKEVLDKIINALKNYATTQNYDYYKLYLKIYQHFIQTIF